MIIPPSNLRPRVKAPICTDVVALWDGYRAIGTKFSTTKLHARSPLLSWKRQAKSWWGQLTDDDLDRIEGESDKLVGALQTASAGLPSSGDYTGKYTYRLEYRAANTERDLVPNFVAKVANFVAVPRNSARISRPILVQFFMSVTQRGTLSGRTSTRAPSV